LDAEGKLIDQIKGDNYGDWYSIEAEDGHGFIGFQETSTYSFLSAIGF